MAEYPYTAHKIVRGVDTRIEMDRIIVALSKDREFQCRMNPDKTISVFVCVCGSIKVKHFAIDDFFDILKDLVK